MSARQLPASDYLQLRGAVRLLVKTAGGSVQAAEITRVAQQRLNEYGLPHGHLFAPIDVVADLEAECGPVVTAALARLQNHVLVPLPEACRNGSVLGRVTAEAMKEVSEVFVAMADAATDGVITLAEAERVGREIDEALAKLLTLKVQVQSASRGE